MPLTGLKHDGYGQAKTEQGVTPSDNVSHLSGPIDNPGQRYPPADPVAKGTLATARQAVRDLFRWQIRVARHHPQQPHNGALSSSATTTATSWEWHPPPKWQNPIRLAAKLDGKGWLFFIVGFLAWTADAYDFHCLSIQTTKLSRYFGVGLEKVASAITFTLLLRSVGAVVFGILGDRFGRKWPMVCNMVMLGLLQIATIYCRTFQQFLAVRALFGLFMGGVFGNAVAMALEHCPTEARGFMSGVLQQGYSFGYVLAAVTNLIVGGADNSWPTAFWVGATFSLAIGLARVAFPESKQFLESKALKKSGKVPKAQFSKDLGRMIRQEWRMIFYCCLLMTWFNLYSHTSQDSYTTFVRTQKMLDYPAANRASILMKTGACVGGTIIGYTSQFIGRRRAMMLSAVASIALIPAWILPTSEAGLSVGGFFIQFFVQGAWGVIPIHLNELSPPAFRSLFPGLTYQIGNMISSPATQIVNEIAVRRKVHNPKTGKLVNAYGPVMGIATAIIATGIFFTVMFGPEHRGRVFEHAVAGVNPDADGDNLESLVADPTRADSRHIDTGTTLEKNTSVPEPAQHEEAAKSRSEKVAL